MTSNREKRKIGRGGALKLKGTDWDPAQFRAKTPTEKLQELAASEIAATAYGEESVCSECAAERTRLGDETALCATHLAQAMGF